MMLDQLDDPFRAWLYLEKEKKDDEIMTCPACDQIITFAGIRINKRIYCYDCAQEIKEGEKK
jgi:uncharacterized paraquat-inducible protein A